METQGRKCVQWREDLLWDLAFGGYSIDNTSRDQSKLKGEHVGKGRFFCGQSHWEMEWELGKVKEMFWVGFW